MAVYVERPAMIPRFTVHGNMVRMALIDSKNRQLCFEMPEGDLAHIVLSAIAAQERFQKRRIEDLTRDIAVP
jgi:hypothetical protein